MLSLNNSGVPSSVVDVAGTVEVSLEAGESGRVEVQEAQVIRRRSVDQGGATQAEVEEAWNRARAMEVG